MEVRRLIISGVLAVALVAGVVILVRRNRIPNPTQVSETAKKDNDSKDKENTPKKDQNSVAPTKA
jgi:hypothetical protein